MKPALFFGANNERTFALKPLFFREHGQGQAIVVLHGLGSSSEETFFAVTPKRRSIHIDLPGFGHSKQCEDSMERIVSRVFGVLDKLQIKTANWVGLSFGGHVSLKAAEIAPHRVKSLFLVSSGGLDPNPPAALAAAFDEEKLAARSSPQVHFTCEALSARKNEYTDAFTKRRIEEHQFSDYQAIANSAKAALNDNVGKRLEEITIPTAIVHGALDPMISIKTAKEAQQRLPNSQLAILQDCAHMPWLEAPKTLQNLLSQFLEDPFQPLDPVLPCLKENPPQ
ncbi:MAG: alpha/beta hydrolase [Planctomycetota bacterium]|nr:alpha/beta hydrolase [Planctomycetota bacterium]